jgi:hypothetical protein
VRLRHFSQPKGKNSLSSQSPIQPSKTAIVVVAILYARKFGRAFMDSETFTADTIEEAKKMMARWLSHHTVTVKKEHAPLEVCGCCWRQ